MRYLIRKESNVLLFLVDRNITKRFWWTYKLSLAMKFVSEDAAKLKAESLKYGKVTVITEDEAKKLRVTADREHRELQDVEDTMHPYDSYSLGQD